MFKSSLLKKSLLILGMPVLASAAVTYFDPADTNTVPKTLSALGIYQNITALPISQKKLDTNAFHFEVNSPLWSDDAHKTRWVLLKNRNKPGGAGSIKYSELDDSWGYPESTLFIKNFAIDTNGLDTNSRVLWETRILINKKDTIDASTGKLSDHWYGFSYRWRKDQKDADIVSFKYGLDTSIRVWPNGPGAGKTSYMKKWHYPTIYQCDNCHRGNSWESDSTRGRAVLGFFTAQLNRPHPDVTPTINQLEYFFQKKVLTGTKTANWDAATVPHWRGVDDSNFTTDKWTSLDVRARSFIAANCSGCHGRRGIETGAAMGVDLNYDFHTMQSQMEFRHRATSWYFNLDTLEPINYPKTDSKYNPQGLDNLFIEPALIVPGYPEKSVLLFRQKDRNATPGVYDKSQYQMPPLATYEVNEKAVKVMTDWIKGMPPVVSIHRSAHARAMLKGPAIRGNMVALPSELAKNGVSVKLTGIDGRTVELKPMSRTTFALPAGLPKGVYIIRVGQQNFTRYLF